MATSGRKTSWPPEDALPASVSEVDLTVLKRAHEVQCLGSILVARKLYEPRTCSR